MPFAAGATLGPYEITSLLGEGGMGAVYRARDSRLGRDVAIKVLSADAVGDANRRARFEAEARAASALNHPNILAIYDIGEHEGHPYIVSELVDGEMLRATVDRGLTPIRRVLDIAVQIADGLAAAHEAKITHRDLKPENIMLTRDGRLKILDFGLAKVSAAPSNDEATVRIAAALSEPGAVMGTVAYMSPEQARGQSVDYRTDQFALGVILHELLTGKQPFHRDSTPETMTAIIKDDPPPLDPSTPAPLRWSIDRMLAKDPEDRYSSTKDLFRDLRTLRERLSETQSNATQTVNPVAAPRKTVGWLWPAITIAVAIACLFAADNPAIDMRRINFTPLASGEFYLESLAWAPDGKGFFVGTRGGQILQYPLDGGPPAQLLRTPASRPNSIHPSPDGRIVYYTTSFKGTRSLMAVSAAGGNAELVYSLSGFDTVKGSAISPDGKWIIVLKRDQHLAFATPPGAPLQDYPQSLSWKSNGRVYLQFCPDSRCVLLSSSDVPGSPEPAEAFLLPWPPASGAPKRLPIDKDIWRAQFSWLPDGRHTLSAISTRFGEGFRLAVTDDRLREVSPITTGNDTVRRYADIDSRGRALVAENTQDLNNVLIPLDGGPVRSVGSDFQQEMFPAWMPDGEHFVSFINRRGDNQLWLWNKDGTPVRSLVSGTLGPLGLSVSPDGRQIAFGAGNEVYLVASTGGTPVKLATGSYPSWSPDSSFLVYVDRAITGVPRKLKVGSNQTSEPLGTADFVGRPVISPDGQWLLMYSNRGVTILSADGKVNKTTIPTGLYTSFTWSHDSKSILMTDLGSAGSRISRYTLDGTESLIRELPGVSLTANVPVNISLSPDGKTLLTTERRESSRVLLLEGLHAPRRFYQRWFTR